MRLEIYFSDHPQQLFPPALQNNIWTLYFLLYTRNIEIADSLQWLQSFCKDLEGFILLSITIWIQVQYSSFLLPCSAKYKPQRLCSLCQLWFQSAFVQFDLIPLRLGSLSGNILLIISIDRPLAFLWRTWASILLKCLFWWEFWPHLFMIRRGLRQKSLLNQGLFF